MKKYFRGFVSPVYFLFFVMFFFFSTGSYSAPLISKAEKAIHDSPDSVSEHSERMLKRENGILLRDLKRLKSFSVELESMKAEMYLMRERSRVWDLKIFPPEEHDRIESLLFRYLAIRDSIWEMIDYYKDYREHFSDPVSQTLHA